MNGSKAAKYTGIHNTTACRLIRAAQKKIAEADGGEPNDEKSAADAGAEKSLTKGSGKRKPVYTSEDDAEEGKAKKKTRGPKASGKKAGKAKGGEQGGDENVVVKQEGNEGQANMGAGD